MPSPLVFFGQKKRTAGGKKWSASNKKKREPGLCGWTNQMLHAVQKRANEEMQGEEIRRAEKGEENVVVVVVTITNNQRPRNDQR